MAWQANEPNLEPAVLAVFARLVKNSVVQVAAERVRSLWHHEGCATYRFCLVFNANVATNAADYCTLLHAAAW